jgi:hypothetical protein
MPENKDYLLFHSTKLNPHNINNIKTKKCHNFCNTEIAMDKLKPSVERVVHSVMGGV